MRPTILALAAFLAGCTAQPDEVPGYAGLERRVEQHQVGQASDHWIEMQNMAGEWERTGLIFGYADDYGECLKAIAGMKETNFAREYRCVPAN